MGQICISVNRIYVVDEVAQAFTYGLARGAQRLKIGNGLDSDVDLGDMFSREQRDKPRSMWPCFGERSRASMWRQGAGGRGL